MADQPEVPEAGEPSVVGRVFDELPSMVLATAGPEHRIVAATRAYRVFTDRPDLVGRTVGEVFAELTGRPAPQLLDQVYESGEPLSCESVLARMVLPNAGPVEFLADVVIHPRRGPDGAVVGLMLEMTDVTARGRERQASRRREDEARQRYDQVRAVIDALQRELLPAGVPVLPRVRIAASYLLAESDTAAGGDWFDALTLPDGRVALVVGDVVGHGVAASATMGQLRILLREHLGRHDLPAALRALDAAAGRIRGAQAATVCVVILDPATGAVEYCTAGHPPPLVTSTTGESRYLLATGARPIGVGGDFTTASIGTDRLAEGELVLLYTDGILERAGRDPAQSTVELAEAAGDVVRRGGADSPAERLCTTTLELLTRVTGHSDDITLLAGQLVAAPPDLRLEVPADHDSLTPVRERLDAWLTTARVSRRDADALRHAVVELVTNAVEHAYIDSVAHHLVTIRAALTPVGAVHIQVLDQGRWRTPAPSADRGLGLRVTERLVDTVHLDHDEHGTTATVTHQLSRPASLLTAQDLAWSPTSPSLVPPRPFLILDQPSAPGPRIRVDGPVDTTTVAEFERAALTAGSTGTSPLTIDLTEITHLASAAVASLHRLAALHRDNDTALRIYAPTGTSADMILSLVRLPHHTVDPDYPPPAG